LAIRCADPTRSVNVRMNIGYTGPLIKPYATTKLNEYWRRLTISRWRLEIHH